MAHVLLVGAEELENLGTRYLAAVLRQHGYTVDLASFSTEDEMQEVVSHVEHTKPRLIGLSIIFQYRALEFLELAQQIKNVAPEVHVCLGGHFPTFTARELLRDYSQIDSIVRGEGELTLLELVQKLDAPDKWTEIQGLSFRRNGGVFENPPRPLVQNLDTLPFPARDTLPQYHLGVGFSPIVGSRGCYCNCLFCSIRSFYRASYGQVQRFRSVPNLVDEMQMLYNDLGVRFFIFNDDEWFPAGEERITRVKALERELEQRNLDIIMSIKCRTDDVDYDMFRKLKEIGVERAYVGVESGSDRSLKRFNKRTSVIQNRQALETLQKVGMLADFGLIFFDPDSSIDDMRANLDFYHEMAGEGQAPLSFGRMEVYAGTPILERLQRENRLSGNYLAWNYTIADSRVEMLFRLMIAGLGRRHYPNEGLAKQCSIANYELVIYKYRMKRRADQSFEDRLKAIVSQVNRHSLTVLEEMLYFVTHEDIFDTRRVNDAAANWATTVNMADIRWRQDLEKWRSAVQLHSVTIGE